MNKYILAAAFLIFTSSILHAIALTSIDPSSGYNTGNIRITMTGSGLDKKTVFRMLRTGYADIAGTLATVESATATTVDFTITGKAQGQWSVEATREFSAPSVLADAFTIKSWATISAIVCHPTPYFPANGVAQLIYELGSDTDVSLYIFNITGELILRKDYYSGASGGTAGTNSVEWNGTSDFGERMPNGVYFCILYSRVSGAKLASGKIAIGR